MVRFKHEEPQSEQRTVDLGVHATDEITYVGAETYSPYEPFMVIEAKRLPAHRNDRKREYVTGSTPSGSPTGGIQRFKLGLHGADVHTAAMIAYVEQETFAHWFSAINQWIREQADCSSKDGCTWHQSEVLRDLDTDEQRAVATSVSDHERSKHCVSTTVRLHHLWVSMQPSKHSA